MALHEESQPIVWYADDALWERFRNGRNVLCPKCFSEEAMAAGVLLMWQPREYTAVTTLAARRGRRRAR